MIHIGMPVFDAAKRECGIVLVNYLADGLRTQLSETLSSQSGHPFLLNREGYWLMAHRESLASGFMFDDGPRVPQFFPIA